MAEGHVFTQAYGSEDIRDQALYLAWSVLAWRRTPALRVHVYTDAPVVYAPLAGAIEVHAMTPQEILRWRGPHDFTHRLKAALFQDMARRFRGDLMLYLDADTFFVRPPEEVLDRLGPGRAVMHLREEHLQQGEPQLRNFARRLRHLSFRGKPIDLDRWMWNAGAIGIHPACFDVVEAWIAFIDEVWPRYRRGLVEQYGISKLLQQAGSISPCDDLVVHYWGQKLEYTAAIRRELEVLRSRPLEDALLYLREHPIQIPFRQPTRRRMPFWRKWRRSLFGER
jgi:hypothetical protein